MSNSKKKEYLLHIIKEIPNLETNILIKIAILVQEENKSAIVESNGGLIINPNILPENLIEKIYDLVKNITKIRQQTKNVV